MKFYAITFLCCLASLVSSCGGGAVGLGRDSDSLTSVRINSTDLAKARRVTRQVFADEGFRETNAASSTIFFTKEGGPKARLAWGGWGNETVMISPEVYLGRSGEGINVELDLYVSTISEAFGESEGRRLWAAGRHAYHSLLKRIKKRTEGR